MKNFFWILTTLLLLSWFWYASNPASILQVNVYEHDAVNGSYDLIQQGSAVVIDATTAVTNAHVVSDEYGETPYHYEVCKTTSPSVKPVCFGSATIKKIRVENDLAVLKFSSQNNIVPVVFTAKEISLWDVVKTLWYPANGWETITQTEWKVSWFDGDYYKTDANLDSWNSWWWAFNSDWELIGIPTFVSVGYSTLGYIVPLSHVNEVLYNTPALTAYSSQSFDAFLKTNAMIWVWDRIITDAYQLNGFESLGFELDIFKSSYHNNAPSFLQISTPNGETVVNIDTYSVQNEEVLIKVGDFMYENAAGDFTLAKNKTITIGWNTWEATFTAWVEWLPTYKSLRFTLRDSETKLSYTITSVERDDQAFVNALILFLKRFELKDSAVLLPPTVQELFEMLSVPYQTIAWSYGYDESWETGYQFVLNESPALPNTLQMIQYEVTQEFKDITYLEFSSYISESIDGYELESEGTGITIEDSYFARNDNDVLFLIQPMYFSDMEQQLAMYNVIVILESWEMATQYMMNLYAQDQNDVNEIKLLLEEFDASKSLSYPFGGVGVDENWISQIQNISLAN